jgi:uncharacterized protein
VLALLRQILYRRPGTILLIALASCVPMGWFSGLLYSDVRADLRELLPKSARSVETLRELERRFGGFSQLSIVIESPDRAANRRFSDDLVAKLEKSPLIRSIRNKPGPEGEFFEQRWWLFIDLKDLEEIRDRMQDASDAVRQKANPLIADLEEEETEKRIRLDLSDIEKKYEDQLAFAQRFPEGYFESADGKSLAVIVRRRGLAFSVNENEALVDVVERTAKELDPKRYHPELVVGLGGDVKNIIEEHHSLVEDLITASVIVSVLLAAVVVGYYRRWRAIWVVGIPVLVGTCWTFGLSHFLIGYLNASSAFLGTIVPGNGINFGLIMFARYIEERRQRQPIEASLDTAMGYTWQSTITASLAASIAYGSLIATDFLGFKHFGIIGGLGMVLCWIATFTVMPALLLWSEKKRALDPSSDIGHRIFPAGSIAPIPARIVSRMPGTLAWFGAGSAIVTAIITVVYLRDPFEKDFHKLRSTFAVEKGAGFWEAKVDQIFGRYLTAQVIIADDEQDVPAIVEQLEQITKSRDPRRPITDVTALQTLVPKDQPKKIEVLREIRTILTDEVIESLDEKQAEQAKKLRPPEDLRSYGREDLPESVRADFRELDGREGRVVLVLPNLALNLYHADEVKRVADVLRSIRLPNGKIVESSGNFVVYADMLDAIVRDGPKATTYSFLGVLILCAIVYKRPKRVLTVTSALLVGVSWLGAYLALSGLRINFLNFIALPITFGIGIDYAVNIYSRYLSEREHSLPKESAQCAVSATGGAVTLCSLTTVIGYGSLLLASNGALISFGKVAIIGELTCLVAAIFVMPAWMMRERA